MGMLPNRDEAAFCNLFALSPPSVILDREAITNDYSAWHSPSRTTCLWNTLDKCDISEGWPIPYNSQEYSWPKLS